MGQAEVLSLLRAVSRPVSSEESAGEFLVHLQVSENTCVPGRPGRTAACGGRAGGQTQSNTQFPGTEAGGGPVPSIGVCHLGAPPSWCPACCAGGHRDGVPSSGLLELGLPCGDTWVSQVCRLALREGTCLLLGAT